MWPRCKDFWNSTDICGHCYNELLIENKQLKREIKKMAEHCNCESTCITLVCGDNICTDCGYAMEFCECHLNCRECKQPIDMCECCLECGYAYERCQCEYCGECGDFIDDCVCNLEDDE